MSKRLIARGEKRSDEDGYSVAYDPHGMHAALEAMRAAVDEAADTSEDYWIGWDAFYEPDGLPENANQAMRDGFNDAWAAAVADHEARQEEQYYQDYCWRW